MASRMHPRPEVLFIMAGGVEFGSPSLKGGRKTIWTKLNRHGINAAEMDPSIKSESLRDQTDEQLAEVDD